MLGKMWTLQISLKGQDFKNMATPSPSTFVTHTNNSKFENADIESEYTMARAWYITGHTFETSELFGLDKCGYYKLEYASHLFKLFRFLRFSTRKAEKHRGV